MKMEIVTICYKGSSFAELVRIFRKESIIIAMKELHLNKAKEADGEGDHMSRRGFYWKWITAIDIANHLKTKKLSKVRYTLHKLNNEGVIETDKWSGVRYWALADIPGFENGHGNWIKRKEVHP